MVSAALLLGANGPVQTGSLAIAVGNVRSGDGRVHVDICPESSFLKSCPYSFSAPARVGTTIVTATNLPFGNYAAQVFHDENNNGKVDRALFGIPTEGVGFSNNAPTHFSAPKYAVAMFRFSESRQTISLKLRYFIGKRGR